MVLRDPNSLESMEFLHVPRNSPFAQRLTTHSAEDARPTVHWGPRALGGMTVVAESSTLDTENAPGLVH